MSIFWSCFWSAIGGCIISWLFGDTPDKYTIIFCAVLGGVIGLDSALSDIKESIAKLKKNTTYDY